MIEFDLLKSLASEAKVALLKWVDTGGNLIVTKNRRPRWVLRQSGAGGTGYAARIRPVGRSTRMATASEQRQRIPGAESSSGPSFDDPSRDLFAYVRNTS